MSQEVTTTKEAALQRVQMYPRYEHSTRLMLCMLKTEAESEEVVQQGKMEVMMAVGALMPNGLPDFKSVVNYPMIKDLIDSEGRATMHKAVLLMVKDLCKSINLVRNMDEGQMIEAAAFLLDECGNFRLEDYLVMFQMAKRGKLVKILDRMDIQVIGQMIDAYWDMRHNAGEQIIGDRQDFDFNQSAVAHFIEHPEVKSVLQVLKDDIAKEKRLEAEEYQRITKIRDEKLKELGFDLSGNVRTTFYQDAINSFCDLIQKGTEMDKTDLQFYANNKEDIEKELKRRKDAA